MGWELRHCLLGILLKCHTTVNVWLVMTSHQRRSFKEESASIVFLLVGQNSDLSQHVAVELKAQHMLTIG